MNLASTPADGKSLMSQFGTWISLGHRRASQHMIGLNNDSDSSVKILIAFYKCSERVRRICALSSGWSLKFQDRMVSIRTVHSIRSAFNLSNSEKRTHLDSERSNCWDAKVTRMEDQASLIKPNKKPDNLRLFVTRINVQIKPLSLYRIETTGLKLLRAPPRDSDIWTQTSNSRVGT